MKTNQLKMFVAVTAAILFAGAAAQASQIDARIESSAQQSYVFRTYLKNDAVQVRSWDGFVTLTGTVTEEAQKSLAQETVASLAGVKGVDNQLELTGARLAEGSDEWISMQVKYAFLYNRHVRSPGIKAFVTDGSVTLIGEAESSAQKVLAGEYAQDIPGVKDVKNEMTIAKAVSRPESTRSDKMDDASITAQVKQALFSRQSTRIFTTGIETNNGVVTISGKATSSAGKDLVTKAAADGQGVTKVINNMTVEGFLSKK